MNWDLDGYYFIMSAKQDTCNTMMMCASCGAAEGDGIKLRTCTACKSVRYCGVTCQRNHRPEHKEACKKRAAELRDEILFRQPESSHHGDCPICSLPIPLGQDGSVYHGCCSKQVCTGCVVANIKRLREERVEHSCPFCRDVTLKGDRNQKMLNRIQANDPSALSYAGLSLYNKKDYEGAFRYFSKAAALGDALSHTNLSHMYLEGLGVEKDEKKEVYHLEEAAIKGHPQARYGLAGYEEGNGRIDRAVKHLIIAANLGHDCSLKQLKRFYANGDVSKEDFASALRAYQAAVNATKSPQREAAKQAAKAAVSLSNMTG